MSTGDEITTMVGASGKRGGFLVLLTLLLGTLLPAQANWTLRSPVTNPPARWFHAMERDSARGRTVLFGGSDGAVVYSDTWEWDGTDWTQRNPAASPPPRLSHAMAYDAARGRLVLFGGGSGGTTYSDTWEWDGANWSQRSPTTNPSARFQHKMAYDAARGRVVLFGGFDTAGVGHRSDTWEWDGTDWTLRNPATIPPVRYWHAMAYDSTRGRVVLFGGNGGPGVYLSDTWEWDGTDWNQHHPAASPPGRWAHAMAFDSARGRVVLFGGLGTTGSRNDIWEWDGTVWSQQSPATSPPVRIAHAMTYDAARGRLVMFGGQNNGINLRFADTWEYGVPNPSLYTPFGPGCAGSAGVPSNTASALPRMGQTLTANVGNLPPPEFAFFIIGFSRTTSALGPLPLDLLGLGAPGCYVRVRIDAVQLLPGAAGSAAFNLAIPGNPAFLGMQFFTQALVMDSGQNALGLVVSDAAVVTIGN